MRGQPVTLWISFFLLVFLSCSRTAVGLEKSAVSSVGLDSVHLVKHPKGGEPQDVRRTFDLACNGHVRSKRLSKRQLETSDSQGSPSNNESPSDSLFHTAHSLNHGEPSEAVQSEPQTPARSRELTAPVAQAGAQTGQGQGQQQQEPVRSPPPALQSQLEQYRAAQRERWQRQLQQEQQQHQPSQHGPVQSTESSSDHVTPGHPEPAGLHEGLGPPGSEVHQDAQGPFHSTQEQVAASQLRELLANLRPVKVRPDAQDPSSVAQRPHSARLHEEQRTPRPSGQEMATSRPVKTHELRRTRSLPNLRRAPSGGFPSLPDCSICLEGMDPRKHDLKPVTCPARHTFHRRCIAPVEAQARRHRVCPYCRSPIDSSPHNSDRERVRRPDSPYPYYRSPIDSSPHNSDRERVRRPDSPYPYYRSPIDSSPHNSDRERVHLPDSPVPHFPHVHSWVPFPDEHQLSPGGEQQHHRTEGLLLHQPFLTDTQQRLHRLSDSPPSHRSHSTEPHAARTHLDSLELLRGRSVSRQSSPTTRPQNTRRAFSPIPPSFLVRWRRYLLSIRARWPENRPHGNEFPPTSAPRTNPFRALATRLRGERRSGPSPESYLPSPSRPRASLINRVIHRLRQARRHSNAAADPFGRADPIIVGRPDFVVRGRPGTILLSPSERDVGLTPR